MISPIRTERSSPSRTRGVCIGVDGQIALRDNDGFLGRGWHRFLRNAARFSFANCH